MTEVALTPSVSLARRGLARAYLSATIGIVRRDAAIRLSYRGSLISQNFGVVFTLATFYFLSKLVRVPPFRSPREYFAYAVIGIVIFGIVRSSLTIAVTVRQELIAGTYERLVLSPFGGTAAIAALMIFPIVYSLAVAFFELILAVVIFGMHIQWSTAALALPLGLAGALAFAPFALAFAAITLAFKQAPGQGSVLAVVSLGSGMYFPVALLPWWLRWISEVQPFTPTVDLLRHVLTAFPLTESPTLAVTKIVGFIALGIPFGIGAVSLAGRYGRRRGTITEY